MQSSRILPAVLVVMAVMSFAGCSHSRDANAGNVHYAVLGADDGPLREDFNRDRRDVRLVFLVDPICPECLRGMADMGDELLAKLGPNAPLKVYVVFEPVIGGQAKDIPAAAALLRWSTSRLYWNPTGDFGRQMSHVLHYWNGHEWVYAWDTWLIYRPEAVWSDEAPPEPAFLMHQLGGLPHTARFPHLDAHVFAAKVRAMMDGIGPMAVSQ